LYQKVVAGAEVTNALRRDEKSSGTICGPADNFLALQNCFCRNPDGVKVSRAQTTAKHNTRPLTVVALAQPVAAQNIPVARVANRDPPSCLPLQN